MGDKRGSVDSKEVFLSLGGHGHYGHQEPV